METEPAAGLPVTVTYNGTAEVPSSLPGVYAVTATVEDARYEGAAEASLPGVAQAPAQIELENLIRVYDGGPKEVAVETSPDELSVVVTYLADGGFPSLRHYQAARAGGDLCRGSLPGR